MSHDRLCRYKYMDVATHIDDDGGCDCPIIAKVRVAERGVVDALLRENYGGRVGPVNLAAVLRLIGGEAS